ncbi:MAG: hypothetical protein QUS09_01130, partial [Methanotrichaceae archaeon]|nr:hypothetical protein [Methanotrichaceae archaeon]
EMCIRDRENTSYLYAQQTVKIDIPDDTGTNSLWLQILVFETPEQAVAFCLQEFKDYGFTEDYQGFTPDYNGLKDPRLEGGEGASSRFGHVIQYKNMVARIEELGSRDRAAPYVPQLGMLWLDKVSKIKPADKPDLHLEPDQIYLSKNENNNLLPIEIAADTQAVAIEVENRGTVEAKNVQLQLYLQKGEEYEPLGNPVPVGDIPPGSVKAASTFWDLEGQNAEGAVLLAQAYIPGEKDANEVDNSAAVKVNIYFAHNGNRAYSWIDDTYRFDNYGFDGRETEEMVEGLLATIAGNMQSDSSLLPAMQRLLFPATYTRFWNYAKQSMTMGAGGHCYGMSATSSLYFMDPGLNPLQKPASQMSLEEASTNIAIYHRAQMLPLWNAMISDFRFFKRDESPAKCHQAVKDALKNSREPIIIEFFGQIGNESAGHAVLAYKLIEVEGREPVVYVYDPNFPEPEARPPRPMSQITLVLSNNNWKNPSYMGYMWAYAGSISAHRVFREIPLQEVNAIVPALKKSIYEMMESLRKANAIMAVLRCPADAVFTDDQGRRVGVVNGQAVNEIPGALALSDGEVEIYQLPAGGKYSMTITATDQGQVDLDVIRPEGDSAGLTSFQDMDVNAGSQISGKLEPQGRIESLKSDSGSIEPTLDTSLDLSGFGEGIQSGEIQGDEGLILDVNTLGAVDNNPTSPTTFVLDRPFNVTKIQTYHWNYGQGQTPGTIALQNLDGKTIGPWQASGELGMGGVPNAYWVVHPNVVFPAGEYTVIDSDPATWSQNSETGGRGIARIWGIAAQSTTSSGTKSEGDTKVNIPSNAQPNAQSQSTFEPQTRPTELMDHGMSVDTEELSSSSDGIFYTTDDQAVSWVRVGPVYGPHDFEWQWYSPDGVPYFSYSVTTDDPRASGKDSFESWMAYSYINIRGDDAEYMPGDWWVDVYMDGKYLLTEEFSILSPDDDYSSYDDYGYGDVIIDAPQSGWEIEQGESI